MGPVGLLPDLYTSKGCFESAANAVSMRPNERSDVTRIADAHLCPFWIWFSVQVTILYLLGPKAITQFSNSVEMTTAKTPLIFSGVKSYQRLVTKEQDLLLSLARVPYPPARKHLDRIQFQVWNSIPVTGDERLLKKFNCTLSLKYVLSCTMIEVGPRLVPRM